MSISGRTRSRSRALSDEADELASHPPFTPSRTTPSRVTPQRARSEAKRSPPTKKQPRVKVKNSYSYGSEGQDDVVQQQYIRQGAQSYAVDQIESTIAQGGRRGQKKLFTLEEEEEGEEGEEDFGLDSRIIPSIEIDSALSGSELGHTGPRGAQAKTFNRENVQRHEKTSYDVPSQSHVSRADFNSQIHVTEKSSQRRFLPFLPWVFMIPLILFLCWNFSSWNTPSDVRQNDYNVSSLVQAELSSMARRIDTLEHQVRYMSPAQKVVEAPRFHKINFFQDGYARIDPRFTSPTAERRLSYEQIYASLTFKRLFGGIAFPTWTTKEQLSMGPDKVFYTWDNVLDRWCAPSNRGKLQAYIELATPVMPAEIVVEHISKDAVLDIGNAPKEIELWVKIEDDNLRESVGDAITTIFPDILTKTASQRGKELAEEQSLDHSFVPVGRWTYDIYASNNVQNFHLPISLKALGVAVRHVAFRVNSNWGSQDQTCLYRLRMYAESHFGVKTYDDLEEA